MILKNNKLQDIFEFLNKFIISITLCSGAQSHDDDGVLQSPFCKNFSPQLYPTLLHTSIHTTKAVVSRIGKCEINCILNVILTKGFLQGGSTIGVRYFLEEQNAFSREINRIMNVAFSKNNVYFYLQKSNLSLTHM